MSHLVRVGARSSKLSRVQVKEVEEMVPVEFETVFVETVGDKDQKTSLRALDKTDFFTHEVDQLLLQGKCDVGIHSAKDLPDPLPQGLKVIAVTKGVDRRDALVYREPLKEGALIATSSHRREENVKKMGNFTFCDIRGTILDRLKQLDEGKVDGVVIAEAALVRLGLTHVKRLYIPGETTPLQGQLAIVAREGDEVMAKLFRAVDTRDK